jgi:hypothetical protein
MAAVIRPRGNVPLERLSWTVERASGEFSVAPVTLRKFLRQSGAEPDPGGCFTTRQITEALYGDLKAERLRKERQLTKKYELENAITEGSFLDRAEIARGLSAVADAMVSRIMSAQLDRTVKEDLLNDLSTVPLILENTARSQSKVPAR